MRPEPQTHKLCRCSQDECLERVHALLARLWEDASTISEPERLAFETAVAEIAANILEHSGEDEIDINLDLTAYGDRVEACFRDTGRIAAVDVGSAELPDTLAERGRGLAVARAAVDEVTYEREGDLNCWRLIKRHATSQ